MKTERNHLRRRDIVPQKEEMMFVYPCKNRQEVVQRASGVENPYPTWQEGGEAAQKLGIGSSTEYRKKACRDPRLPLDPPRFYNSTFPGWNEFLGLNRDFYPTLEEALSAARALGITGPNEYKQKRGQDPRLPASLGRYPGFRGWKKINP